MRALLHCLLTAALLQFGVGAARAQCTFSINVNPGNTFCLGTGVLYATLALPGSTYQWQMAGPGNTWYNIPGATGASYAPVTSGDYRVVVSSTGCPVFTTAPVTVTVLPVPAAPVAAAVTYCQFATSMPLTASGINLQWYTTAVGGIGSLAAPVPPTHLPGTFSYWVSQTAGGCESPRTQVDITVLPKPVITATANPSVVCSAATAVNLGATGATGLSWLSPVGLSCLTCPNPVTAPFTATTTFTVIGQNNNNGCTDTAEVTVTVIAAANPLTWSNSPVCAGDTLQLFATSPLPGATYSWTGPNGFTSASQNPVIPNAGPATAGIYQAVYSVNGCTSGPAAENVIITCLDSVWAGDANSDFTADNNDILEIGISYSSTGPARPGATISWTPQYCPDWSTSILTNSAVNAKHADCDGNGIVDFADTVAVSLNYGLVHPKGLYLPHAKTTGLPDLYLDFDSVSLVPGATVSVPLKLGSPAVPMIPLLGLACRIRLGGITLNDPPAMTYPASWLGAPGNTIRFSKAVSPQRLDWAYVRTDHQNAAGYGTLGHLQLTLPAQLPAGQELRVYLEDVVMVDSAGQILTGYNVLDDTVHIVPAAVGSPLSPVLAATVVPNPSGSQCALRVSLSRPAALQVRVTDMTGRTVWQQQVTGSTGGLYLSLPAAQLGNGIYFVRLLQDQLPAGPALKWVKGY